MNDRYLILENKLHEELTYTIADFLWNNGNEVIVQNNFFDDKYYQNFLRKNPCIITIDDNNFSKSEKWMKDNLFQNDEMAICFSPTGVYTNVIPFPHKIFDYNALTKSQLNLFFEWCMKLNLFSSKGYKKIFLSKNIPISIF